VRAGDTKEYTTSTEDVQPDGEKRIREEATSKPMTTANALRCERGARLCDIF
jgi:hypothetical protein